MSIFQSSLEIRARQFCTQQFLPVHYYRIRKRLAVPLPITGFDFQAHSVRGFDARYPWAIWLLWALEDALPLSDRLHAVFDTPGTLLADTKPHQHLHNIPLIGTCALAMAAKLAGYTTAERLDARVAMLFEAVLDLRAKGFTEGVSYDGYVLDFVADWLSTLNSTLRARILAHPALAGLVEQVLAPAVHKLTELCEVMEVYPLMLLTLAYAGNDTCKSDQLLAQVRQELELLVADLSQKP